MLEGDRERLLDPEPVEVVERLLVPQLVELNETETHMEYVGLEVVELLGVADTVLVLLMEDEPLPLGSREGLSESEGDPHEVGEKEAEGVREGQPEEDGV